MRLLSSSILFLCISAASCADPVSPPPKPRTDPAVTLDLGGPLSVEQGKMCVLTAKTTAKKVTWQPPSTVDTLALDGNRLAVWAVPGSYTVRAAVPNGDDVVFAEMTLVVTGPRPPPPPPPPPDTLLVDVQTAFTADAPSYLFGTGSLTKAQCVSKLASLYSQAAITTVQDQSVKTYGDLFADMQTASATLLPKNAIPGVRKVVGTYLDSQLHPTTATALDREKAKAAFQKVADVMGKVK